MPKNKKAKKQKDHVAPNKEDIVEKHSYTVNNTNEDENRRVLCQKETESSALRKILNELNKDLESNK